jgi:hypothetical protein
MVEWHCFDAENNIVAGGKTLKLQTARDMCKDLYKQLKASDKSIYVKPNNKLTRKRYGTSKTA